jgi:hypothetical protein
MDKSREITSECAGVGHMRRRRDKLEPMRAGLEYALPNLLLIISHIGLSLRSEQCPGTDSQDRAKVPRNLQPAIRNINLCLETERDLETKANQTALLQWHVAYLVTP